KDTPGALIAFDDESGLLSVAWSKEAERQYSALELDLALSEPLLEMRRGGADRQKNLDREKLDRATKIVLDGMIYFHNRAASRARKLWLVGGGLAGVLLIGAGIEILLVLAKKNSSELKL